MVVAVFFELLCKDTAKSVHNKRHKCAGNMALVMYAVKKYVQFWQIIWIFAENVLYLQSKFETIDEQNNG